jgi:hypothetical protein
MLFCTARIERTSMPISTGSRIASVSIALAICLCPAASSGADLAVGHVQVAPRPGTLLHDVTYDLQTVGDQSVLIRLMLSTDGGTTCTVNCQAVSGDVGAGVLPGSDLHIVWDAGAELPGAAHGQCRLRVVAVVPGKTSPPRNVQPIAGPHQAGRHHAVWHGGDRDGRAVPSGAYICRLVAGKHTQALKLLLAR